MVGDKHPELRAGEIFLGNSSANDGQNWSYRTLRKGSVAYDNKGNPHPESVGLFPFFAMQQEVEETEDDGWPEDHFDVMGDVDPDDEEGNRTFEEEKWAERDARIAED